MPIDPIKNNNVASINEIRKDRMKLSTTRDDLSQKISSLQNCVTELKESITVHKKDIVSYQSLLNSLQSVSEKHGENASVRLKNDHFKYSQATNFFKKIYHGNRYQTECKVAAKMANAEGSTVSARMVINTLLPKNNSAWSKVDELNKNVAKYDKVIANIKAIKCTKDKQIDTLAKIEAELEKDYKERCEPLRDFFLIFQTNAGSKSLNEEARHKYRGAPSAGKVSSRTIIQEYISTIGDNAFSHGNKDLASTIKANCKHINKLVVDAAIACYTPTEKNITTYRGQGMTSSGIEQLISQFNVDKQNKTETVYNLGQFFSTSKDVKVAHDFAERSTDNVKIIFAVNGNSSNKLSVPGGLLFENKEDEMLYSPLANVKIKNAFRVAPNSYYNVTLEEVTNGDKAQPLPY